MITESLESLAEISAQVNPYPGLRPFNMEESHLFFGRDNQSEKLTVKLAATRFLVVVGTSGSGKSSLVRAGLLPALFGGAMASAGSNWRIAVMRPGNDPIGNLARALNEPHALATGSAKDALMRFAMTEVTLRRGSRGLVEAVEQSSLGPNDNLLVLVDQFEEIFRFAREARGADGSQEDNFENEAAAFVKLLLEAKCQREFPVHVVLTMRSDFLGDCSEFWDLPEAINESQYLIPRLSRDQLREVITGPIFVAGTAIAPRLVNRLLNDIGNNQDQLPILQHALMRTWDIWREAHAPGELLDLSHYEASGGMEEALSKHADEAFAELNEGQKQIAEKMFKLLTEKGEDNREIRHPVTLGEIGDVTEAADTEVIAVIETFRQPGRSFLMPPAGTGLNAKSLIDISHESLIRVWQRLSDWVKEESQAAERYKRLAGDAVEYEKGEVGLLRDPRLQLDLDWYERTKPNEAWARRYHCAFASAIKYLESSRKGREKEARRRRFLIFGLATACAILAFLAWYAFTQRREALRQKTMAENNAEKYLEQKNIADSNTEKYLQQKIIADSNAEKYLEQKNIADSNAEKYLQQKNIADSNAEKYLQQKIIADSNAEKYLQQKIIADSKAAVALKLSKQAYDIIDDLKQAQDHADAKAGYPEPIISNNVPVASGLRLGSFDSGITRKELESYISYFKRLTSAENWEDKLRGEREGEWVDFQKLTDSKMTVAEMQQFLKNAGFSPFGKINGICGYETTSSIRLFKEYVRTVEGQESIGFPDDHFGPSAEAHVKRWKAGDKKADYAFFSSAKPSPEYTRWLRLLGQVKQKYLAAPTGMLQLVNQFPSHSDTRKVAEWDFNPNQIHLIGIRRNEAYLEAGAGGRKFDDVFILLINGLVFKFFGSTDPGSTSNPMGPPFLVEGQHLYRLGWHKMSDLSKVFFALKPLSNGVLVVRSKNMALTEADLAGGLELNDTINIHWGGEGLFNVGSWSPGTQVIVGKGYINYNGSIVNSSRYAASNFSKLGTVANGVYQTKGAYTMLMDLILAFRRDDDNIVNYFLMNERNLELSPEIGAGAAEEILSRLRALPVI